MWSVEFKLHELLTEGAAEYGLRQVDAVQLLAVEGQTKLPKANHGMLLSIACF
jgi:hypothetical protein